MTGPSLAIDVAGMPRPQPRARTVTRGGKTRTISTTGPAVRWKSIVSATVSAAIRETGWACIESGPVSLGLVFRFPTKDPERWGRPRSAVRNGDFDNMAKLVTDALVTCRVMGDDGQVANAVVWQVWVPGEDAGCSITVERLNDAVLPWASCWRARGQGAASGVAQKETGPCGAGDEDDGLGVPSWLG